MTHAVVVGGGLVGQAAAVVLARAGLDTLHLSPKAGPDRRTSALMMPSVEFLQGEGLVGRADEIGHPLTAIRIIDATGRLIRAPETLFEAEESGLAAFGWNFPNVALNARFSEAAAALPNLQSSELTLRELRREGPAWRLVLADGSSLLAPLVVAADGRRSTVRESAGFSTRERVFAEAALVCDLRVGRPLGGTSVEFHYPRGPFTLVPAGEDRANLVWIDDAAVLKEALHQDSGGLAATLRDKAQRLYGPVELLSPAAVFPLGSLSVDVAGRDAVVLVGEAAHAFPPIGAQGLNLGLRDVADLAAAVRQLPPDSSADWGSQLSNDYGRRRGSDLARTGGMVDALFRSLLSEWLPAQGLRSAGLWALRTTPALRRRAFAMGMGRG